MAVPVGYGFSLVKIVQTKRKNVYGHQQQAKSDMVQPKPGVFFGQGPEIGHNDSNGQDNGNGENDDVDAQKNVFVFGVLIFHVGLKNPLDWFYLFYWFCWLYLLDWLDLLNKRFRAQGSRFRVCTLLVGSNLGYKV
jgi:hypothetical protein